jgi:cellulose biosynthesis protein BcsQ
MLIEELPILQANFSSSIKIRELYQQCKPLIFLDQQNKMALEFRELYHKLQSR